MNRSVTSITLGDCRIEAVDIFKLSEADNLQTEMKHNHSFYELHLIKKGVSKLMVDGKLYQTQKDQIIVIPKNAYHYAAENDGDLCFAAFSFDFAREKGTGKSEKREFAYFTGVFDMTGPVVLPVTAKLERTADEIAALRNRTDLYSANMLSIKIAEFFLELAAAIDRGGEKRFIAENSLPDDDVVRKQKIDDMLVTERDGTLEEFARAVYLSPRQFERFVLAAYDKTFRELKREKRMIRSLQLIEEDKHSLAHIATEAGFSSYGGFCAAFKKYYGIHPSLVAKKGERRTPPDGNGPG